MSITDELIDYAEKAPDYVFTRELPHIADRIDAEHESKISRAAQLLADAEKDRDFNYANWQDCKQKVLQHNITIDELDAEIERLKDELAHCIELPKDADGEYIHIGDMMENLREDFEPLFHHTFRVYGIQYRAYGQECTLTEDGYPSIQYRASEVRHHHEPTVEDVLREFGEKYCDMVAGSDKERELFAEYASKLQLKEQE